MDLSERGAATARHPWEIERFHAYRRLLSDHAALGARRVLDVGAGDGWFSEALLEHLPSTVSVTCWDVNYNELELATGDPRLTRTAVRPAPGFDLVLLLDVLEHIADPRRFITGQLRPLASPGTAVLASVPAQPLLFGDHDRALGHHRRYRPAEFLAEIGEWVDVEEHGPLFASLVPVRGATVLLERLRRGDPRRHGVGDWDAGALATRVARAALAADARATRRLGSIGRRLPGLSYWAFGRVR